MIPYRDENPQLLIPYATYIIVFINIAVWIFLQGAGDVTTLNSSICEYGVIPGVIIGDVNDYDYCTKGNIGSLSLLASMFLHGGWMHIIGNMIFLWIFGGNVEDSMGSFRFVVFYLLSGLTATIAQVLWDGSSLTPMIGASGAIGGVMGGYLFLYPKVRVSLVAFLIIPFTFSLPAYAMLGYWFLLQLASGLLSDSGSGGVAFLAHVGGFVSGVVLVYLMKDEELLTGHPYRGWVDRKHPSSIWDEPNNRFKND